MNSPIPEYAELRCVSNFSFLRGASQPEELVDRAHQLGYTALAITDECSMAGVVRAHVAAKEAGLKLLLGSQFLIDWGEAAPRTTAPFVLTVLACNLNGYGNLCQFITKLRRSSEKGTYHLDIADIAGTELTNCVVLASPQRMSKPAQLTSVADWLLTHFPERCWFGVDQLRLLTDEMWLHRLREVSASSSIPLVAAGDVRFHVKSRRRHPLALLRSKLDEQRFLTSEQLDEQPTGRQVRYCGIVTLRQQPETANGTVFISLEDETGVVQVICWKSLRDAQRQEMLKSRLMAVTGPGSERGRSRTSSQSG